MEIWKDVIGYEGYYQISNLGRVKSLTRVAKRSVKGNMLIRGRVLVNSLNSNGYYQVDLKKGKRKQHRVHRLVALHFLIKANDKPFVNHIDGVKTNNNLSNLEWCTRSENGIHAYALGLNKPYWKGVKSKDHHSSKKVQATNIKTKEVLEFHSATDAEDSGFSRFCICFCCSGKIKTHKGHTWKFIN